MSNKTFLYLNLVEFVIILRNVEKNRNFSEGNPRAFPKSMTSRINYKMARNFCHFKEPVTPVKFVYCVGDGDVEEYDSDREVEEINCALDNNNDASDYCSDFQEEQVNEKKLVDFASLYER